MGYIILSVIFGLAGLGMGIAAFIAILNTSSQTQKTAETLDEILRTLKSGVGGIGSPTAPGRPGQLLPLAATGQPAVAARTAPQDQMATDGTSAEATKLQSAVTQESVDAVYNALHASPGMSGTELWQAAPWLSDQELRATVQHLVTQGIVEKWGADYYTAV